MVRKSNTKNQLIKRFTEIFQGKFEEKWLEKDRQVLRQAAISQIMERVERRLSPASKSS